MIITITRTIIKKTVTLRMYDLLITPFQDFEFMRRALVACVALSVGAGPVGVFLVLRRMSLMGDAVGHAVLPGVAAGFLLSGLSLGAMTLGGVIAGLLVALLAGATARMTGLKEDASLAGFYLMSLSIGVLLVSSSGSQVDLLNILFGSILAVDDQGLWLVASVSTVSTLVMCVMFRTLVLECFDPVYARAVGAGGGWAHAFFLVLVVLNLVAAFQALGTLMAVGLMILPALASRFWSENISNLVVIAIGFAVVSSISGLLLSYHVEWASGPCIVLMASAIYVFSIVLGSNHGLLPQRSRRPHIHEPESTAK